MKLSFWAFLVFFIIDTFWKYTQYRINKLVHERLVRLEQMLGILTKQKGVGKC